MQQNDKEKQDSLPTKLSQVEDIAKRKFLKKCYKYSKPVITLLFADAVLTTKLNAASNSEEGWY